MTSSCAGATGRQACASWRSSLRRCFCSGSRSDSCIRITTCLEPAKRRVELGGNFCFRCRAGGAFLSCVGPKPVGAPGRPHDRLVVASVLFGLSHFNKTIRDIQLALCSVGHDRRNFLRPCVARASPRARFGHYPHLRGLAMVVVVLETSAQHFIELEIYPGRCWIGPEK